MCWHPLAFVQRLKTLNSSCMCFSAVTTQACKIWSTFFPSNAASAATDMSSISLYGDENGSAPASLGFIWWA